MDPDEKEDGTAQPRTEPGRQAISALRAIWTATGQMQEDLGLECPPGEAGCSTSLGFDAFADNVEPTTDTGAAIDALRRAWKTTLAREGKLYDPDGGPAPVEPPSEQQEGRAE